MKQLYCNWYLRCGFVFLLIWIESYACDPVLESLIFSKSRVEAIDLHFREFSTRLSEMGSQWRSRRQFDGETVVMMKAVWLQIYQNYYLRPPKYFEHKEFWKKQLDRIAVSLKELGLYVEKDLPQGAHQLILRIQSTLVDLYDRSKEMTLFQRGKFLEHLIELYYKSRKELKLDTSDEGLNDFKRLKERLNVDWMLIHSQLSQNLQFKWPKELWRKQLSLLLKADDKVQGLSKVHDFMKRIYEDSWKNLERK